MRGDDAADGASHGADALLSGHAPGRTTSSYAARAAATIEDGLAAGRAQACRKAARYRTNGFAGAEVRAHATRACHVARETRATTSP